MDQKAEDFAVALAKKAGDIMRANFTLGTKKMWKQDNSPLTATDVAINEMVFEAVKDAYPEHAFIGEEGSFGDTANAEWVWVCDPVDGTLPFSSGSPTFVFSLGLAHNGEAVLGVLYDPFMDRLVAARKGHGATLNGEPTRVGDFESLNRTPLEVELPGHLMNGAQMRTSLHKAGADVFQFCSIAYAGLLVAAGELGAALYTSRSPWDGCAVDVIVREAGGQVTSLRGEANKYNGEIEGFLASNGKLHTELLALIAEEYPASD